VKVINSLVLIVFGILITACAASPKKTLYLGLSGHEICGMADLIVKTKLYREKKTGYYANSFACVEVDKTKDISEVKLKNSYITAEKRAAMILVKVPKGKALDQDSLLVVLNKYGKAIKANVMVTNNEHSLNTKTLLVYDGYYIDE